MELLSNFWTIQKYLHLTHQKPFTVITYVQHYSGITLENAEVLERIQKCGFKIMLKENYKTYQNALRLLDFDKLDERHNTYVYNLPKSASDMEN